MICVNSSEIRLWKNYIIKTDSKCDQNKLEKLQIGINLKEKKTYPFKIKISKNNSKVDTIKYYFKRGKQKNKKNYKFAVL